MTSRTTVLMVVAFIGAITLALVLGQTYLISTHNEVPGEMWTLTAAGLAGLTGMLVSTRSGLGEKEREPTILVPAPQPATPSSSTVTVTTEAEPVNPRQP